MAALVHGLEFPYFIAQVVTTGLVLIWNFTANRFGVFYDAPARSGREQGFGC
jgi:hypothetical protein